MSSHLCVLAGEAEARPKEEPACSERLLREVLSHVRRNAQKMSGESPAPGGFVCSQVSHVLAE